jgi:hypothetical protein
MEQEAQSNVVDLKTLENRNCYYEDAVLNRNNANIYFGGVVNSFKRWLDMENDTDVLGDEYHLWMESLKDAAKVVNISLRQLGNAETLLQDARTKLTNNNNEQVNIDKTNDEEC